jgi:thioredoxin 1
MVKIIAPAEFEKEVLHSKEPVLLDFYADWCPPCKALAPELEKLDKLAGGQLKIVKLNVDHLKPGDEAGKLMHEIGIRIF